MSDQYERYRSLSFRAIASASGISLEHFKTRKGKHGQELYGPCPFQKQKNNTGSFSYSDSGLWHCFSCNKHGRGAIDFIKELRECGFQQAIDYLTVIEPLKQKEPRYEAPVDGDEVLKPLEKDSWRNYAVPCPWLEARCPDTAIREKYGVFCYNNPARRSAYSNRVMIPVRDLSGVLHGYLGRSFAPTDSSEPKYLFPPRLPKSRFLFGCHELRQHLSSLGGGQAFYRHVYLLESPFAVLRFASLGLPAVSPFGWSVSTEQIQLLTTLTKGIVYLPDRNKRQESGSHVAILAAHMWVRFPPLPDGIDDPEYLTKEQILSL